MGINKKGIRWLPLLALLLLVSGCSSLNIYLSGDYPGGKPQRVAILEFKDNDQTLGTHVRDNIIDILELELFGTGEYELVGRGDVEKAFQERGFEGKGDLSRDELISLGEDLGADILLIGQILEYRSSDFFSYTNSISLSITLIEGRSGEMIGKVFYSDWSYLFPSVDFLSRIAIKEIVKQVTVRLVEGYE